MNEIDIYDDSYLAVNGDQDNIIMNNEATDQVQSSKNFDFQSRTVDRLRLFLRLFSNSDQAEVFNFDRVMQPETTQQEVYTVTTANLVSQALVGAKCCLFSYGASGSGKTFTIMGGMQNDAGMLPRAVRSLFHSLENKIDHTVDLVTRDGFTVQKPEKGELLENRKIKTEIIRSSKFKA